MRCFYFTLSFGVNVNENKQKTQFAIIFERKSVGKLIFEDIFLIFAQNVIGVIDLDHLDEFYLQVCRLFHKMRDIT